MIVNQDVDLNKPTFAHISALAKDFILKALTKDATKRFSAE